MFKCSVRCASITQPLGGCEGGGWTENGMGGSEAEVVEEVSLSAIVPGSTQSDVARAGVFACRPQGSLGGRPDRRSEQARPKLAIAFYPTCSTSEYVANAYIYSVPAATALSKSRISGRDRRSATPPSRGRAPPARGGKLNPARRGRSRPADGRTSGRGRPFPRAGATASLPAT